MTTPRPPGRLRPVRPLGGAPDRHPSARPRRRDLLALARVTARRLAAAGAPHPEVGAAALASRGVRSVDRAERAGSLGVTDAELAAIESGDVSFDDVPPTLHLSDPFTGLLAALRAEGW